MDVTLGPFKLYGWGWVDDVLWDQVLEQCGRYGFEINLLYAAAKGGSVESIRLLLEVSSFYSKCNIIQNCGISASQKISIDYI